LTYAAYGIDRFDVPVGYISPEGRSGSWGPGLDPIPERAQIEWRDAEGLHHSQTLLVTPDLPSSKRFAGHLYIVYAGIDRGWLVLPMSYKDMMPFVARLESSEPSMPPIVPR
jgi:hypothetical protein